MARDRATRAHRDPTGRNRTTDVRGEWFRVEQVQVDAEDRIVLVCAECAVERVFEQPPCADGHGADCPEWACTGCGAAVLVGLAPAAGPAGGRARSRPVRESRPPRDLDARDLANRDLARDLAARDLLDRRRDGARIPA